MNSSNSMFVSSKTIFRRNLPRDLKKWYFVRKRGKDWRMLWVRKIGRIRFTNRGYKSYSFVCILSIHSNNPLLWWSFRDYENTPIADQQTKIKTFISYNFVWGRFSVNSSRPEHCKEQRIYFSLQMLIMVKKWIRFSCAKGTKRELLSRTMKFDLHSVHSVGKLFLISQSLNWLTPTSMQLPVVLLESLSMFISSIECYRSRKEEGGTLLFS